MATARKSLTSKKVSWEARYYIRKPYSGLIYIKLKRGFYKIRSIGIRNRTWTRIIRFFKYHNVRNVWQSNNANKTTTDKRRNCLIKYADIIINQPMNRITKAALQSWRSDLESNSRIATATKNDLIGFVKQIFTFAYNTYDFYDSAKILKPFKKLWMTLMKCTSLLPKISTRW